MTDPATDKMVYEEKITPTTYEYTVPSRANIFYYFRRDAFFRSPLSGCCNIPTPPGSLPYYILTATLGGEFF